jgi:hypothetical protein
MGRSVPSGLVGPDHNAILSKPRLTKLQKAPDGACMARDGGYPGLMVIRTVLFALAPACSLPVTGIGTVQSGDTAAQPPSRPT